MNNKSTTILSAKEIYLVKFHFLLARFLNGITYHSGIIKNIFYLFSKKRGAKIIMKTGECFEAQGETEVAVDYYLKALRRNSGSPEIHLNLCRCYLRLLSLEKSGLHGRKCLKKLPECPEVNLYMGVLSYYEGDINKAIDYLNKSDDELPRKELKRAAVLEYLGLCYVKLSQHEQAVKYFEESMWVNPFSQGDKKLVSLGETYYFLGRKDDALNAFKKAISINPGNHETWNNIGVILWSDGQGENSCQCFSKALEIEPEYGEARTNLTMVENELGLQKGRKNKQTKSKVLR